jgi:hypothetical protein
MAVVVTPEHFDYVEFDRNRLVSICEQLLDELGMSSSSLRVEVDEVARLGSARVASLDPLVLDVQGGAIEDPKRARHLSEPATVRVIGKLLLRARDLVSPGFDGPDPGDQIDVALRAAWDAYCLGRLDRLGHPAQRQRFLYAFRTQHGFTDQADAAFERLWSAEGLTWTDIEGMSARAREAGVTPDPVR